jgi:anthranilate phosphoribosyltransferase
MKHITVAEAIQRTVEHREVFHDEMLHVMRQIMRGELTPAQIAGFIIGLRVKKETIGEIAAAAQVMRELATHVEVRERSPGRHLRHGRRCRAHLQRIDLRLVRRRGRGRQSGEAHRALGASLFRQRQVLEALGANIGMTPAQTAEAIDRIGLGFMFAPAHHAAMKYAAPVRRSSACAPFNILGPLTTPPAPRTGCSAYSTPTSSASSARAPAPGLQARDGGLRPRRAGRDLGVRRDLVGELVNGEIREYTLHPSHFGLELYDRRAIRCRAWTRSKR